MAMATVAGVFRDGKVELAELPEGVGSSAQVLVTFLPASPATEGEPPSSAEARRAAGERLIDGLRRGIFFGGATYTKREELYDRHGPMPG